MKLLLGFAFTGLAAAQTPPGTLVYADEFNGTAMDPSAWRVATGAGQGQEYFTPGACQVHDGSLHLVSGNQAVKVDQAGGKTYALTSCRVESNFSFLYGHVELRAKLPAGKGYWPGLRIRTDQVNFVLPAEVRGMGEIPIALVVNGIAANVVTLNIGP